MPVSGEVPWERDPHTAAKHEVYRAYLDKWFPILLSDNGYPSVTYAEGFAGPGTYKDSSDGSPIIAVRALLETSKLAGSRKVTRFLFVDNDPRCVASLKHQLIANFPERPRPADLMPVEVVEGTCRDAFEPSLDRLGAWHQPVLAVFDSWGNAPVPYALMRRLAQNPSSEVVVTFGPQHFIRFVGQLDQSVDEVFGHDASWRAIADLPDGPSKKRFLLSCYRNMLGSAGFKFILDFELVTRNGESLYLIFGTNHRRGLEKMKQSVWEVDRLHGVGFRDPRDEGEEPLFDLTDPVLQPLQRLLMAHMKAGEPTRVETLRSFALFQTVYREQHVIPALEHLLDAGKVVCQDPRVRRASIVRSTNTQ